MGIAPLIVICTVLSFSTNFVELDAKHATKRLENQNNSHNRRNNQGFAFHRHIFQNSGQYDNFNRPGNPQYGNYGDYDQYGNEILTEGPNLIGGLDDYPIDLANYYDHEDYYDEAYYDHFHPVYEFEGGDYIPEKNPENPGCEFLCEEKYCNPEQKRSFHRSNNNNRTRRHYNPEGCTNQPNNVKGTTKLPKCGVPSIRPEITIINGKIEGFTRHRNHHGHRLEDIVNGNVARPNSYPWLVSIMMHVGGGEWQHVCGGSLVDDRHVITAAHCFMCSKLSDFRFVVGEHDWGTPDENTQTSCAKQIIIHERYEKTIKNAFDAAVVVLATPIKFNDFAKPICLPNSKQNWQKPKNPNEKFAIAGWGDLREGGKGLKVTVMNEGVVKVLPVSECKLLFPGYVGPTMMCTHSKRNIDNCQGDSGGPLMAFRRRWVLAGIVSWGIGCGRPGEPGVFAHVPSLLPWFKQKINCPECFQD